jgi:hypothetical protein
MPLAPTATVTLTKADIDTALPRVAEGLDRYLWLQARRDGGDVRSDALYRKRFNAFYKVCRNRRWQDGFFDLLEGMKRARTVSFDDVLDTLYGATGRVEASFASKLVATLDPDMPVIDSMVLRNLNLRLPAFGTEQRSSGVKELHRALVTSFAEFLKTENGRYLVRRFRETYPTANITETKMLDLVLWQTRSVKPRQP